MSLRVHLVGCLFTAYPMDDFIGSALEQAERLGAQTTRRSETEGRFVAFDAADAQLILLASRLVLMHEPPLVRFGFASGVMESGAQNELRISERSNTQAVELARAARNGEVLLSSQLGSLLQVAQEKIAARLRASYVTLNDGRRASVYSIDWTTGRGVAV